MPRDAAAAARWLQFATDDLKAARLMAREGLYHLACFHAQQTVEKVLKAYLAAHQGITPRDHHLVVLLRYSARAGLKKPALYRVCKILDQYYLPTRYPDALVGSLPQGLPTHPHAVEAIQLARLALRAVRRLV